MMDSPMFWMHFFGFLGILVVQGAQIWRHSIQRKWDIQDRKEKHEAIERQLGGATDAANAAYHEANNVNEKLNRIANGPEGE